MSYLTRPSNVRVYQFRQPPLLRRRILPVPTPKGQRTDVGKLLRTVRLLRTIWRRCPLRDSNPRPSVPKTDALVH